MRIKKIVLGRKSQDTLAVKQEPDSCLYIFRTPVTIRANGAASEYSGTTALIRDSGEFTVRGASESGVKFDMISFRLSSADRQYLSSMNLPFDTPIMLADDFVISTAMKGMKLQWDSSTVRRSELGELYMRIIFIDLEEKHTTGTTTTELHIPKYSLLKQLRESIYSDPVKERSVEEVCSELDMSRSYFHRLYSQAFGVTFNQDVIESRLTYAAELLRNTDMSVSAVAEKCGYESDAYFMRQFRKHRGCTPTEFRRKNEEK